MDCDNVKPGMRVKTSSFLGTTGGMFIAQDLLNQRKPDQIGTVYTWVGGHGGDVWYVVHDAPEGEITKYTNANGQEFYRRELVAPYMFTEIEPVLDTFETDDPHSKPTREMKRVKVPSQDDPTVKTTAIQE